VSDVPAYRPPMSADTGPQTRLVAGRYVLGEVLGRGGMGVVWEATDKVLERQVALKEITFSVHLTDEERDVLRERTMREARAAARLDHPCVTTVFDVVEQDGKPWVVMERVASRSLQEIVEEEGPLPPSAVARIGLDVLAALEAAHAAGIVHRDVKPANVLVNGEGRACLTDFGIATSTGDSTLTGAGAFIGSPSYVAPERAQGLPPGPSIDLWSLGATLYTAVEGRLAFDRDEPMATLMAVVSEPPEPMEQAGPLEPTIRALLDKDPAHRATGDQVHRELHAVLDGSASGAPAWTPPPPSATPPPPRTERPLHDDRVERIDADDLKALASISRAVLGSVARDARDQARYLSERRKARRETPPPAAAAPAGRSARAGRRARAGAPAAPPRRRRRFKRRWVVVPVLLTIVGVVLLLAVAAALLAAVVGLL
jgi:serine/threonine protein kinase